MSNYYRKNINSGTVILFLFFMFSLISSDMVQAAQNVSAKGDNSKTDNASTAEGIRLGKDYLYDPTDKTDPFQSFIAVREEQEKEEEKTKPRTYLETLELSQLDLIVIVIGKEGRWAMVRDSKGLGHVIKEGTPIGTNDGVVYKIAEGEVIIREEYKDFRGRTQIREIKKQTPTIR